jgi:hypothetical protein
LTGNTETEIGLSLFSGIPGNMIGNRTDAYLFSTLPISLSVFSTTMEVKILSSNPGCEIPASPGRQLLRRW